MTAYHMTMRTTGQTDDFVEARLRDHVLTHLSTAERVVTAEYVEVDTERQAFVEFEKRVASLDTTATSQSVSAQAPHVCVVKSHPRENERLRSAFREMVMSVDHYEQTYGESLIEHVAAELSPDVVAGFKRGTTTPLTEWYKTRLTSTIDDAIDRRERFLEELDAERRSLETSWATLYEIITSQQVADTPGRYRRDFETRLDELAQTRQETLQSRTPSFRTNNHELCQYLYRNYEWTYPVLTAITRFRRSV